MFTRSASFFSSSWLTRCPTTLISFPCTRLLGSIDQQEPSRLGSIDRRFRGDLEVIVAKALEKKKTARYAAAADLASDIRRYFAGNQSEQGKSALPNDPALGSPQSSGRPARLRLSL